MKIRSIVRTHVPSLTGIAAAALCFVLVGFAATASAQSIGKVNIDFPFVAASTQCAPGAYEFESDGGKIVLRSKEPKGPTVLMMVITRLGRHDKDPEAELVFDKVNNTLSLSEFWLPNQDGFLVLNTPGAHEHRVLGGSNPHK
jgi:hypothetical protein